MLFTTKLSIESIITLSQFLYCSEFWNFVEVVLERVDRHIPFPNLASDTQKYSRLQTLKSIGQTDGITYNVLNRISPVALSIRCYTNILTYMQEKLLYSKIVCMFGSICLNNSCLLLALHFCTQNYFWMQISLGLGLRRKCNRIWRKSEMIYNVLYSITNKIEKLTLQKLFKV